MPRFQCFAGPAAKLAHIGVSTPDQKGYDGLTLCKRTSAAVAYHGSIMLEMLCKACLREMAQQTDNATITAGSIGVEEIR